MDDLFIQKLQELINFVNRMNDSLSDDVFDSIQRRAEAISKKAFGNANIYQKHFNTLSAWSTIYKEEVLTILNDMLYELQLNGTSLKTDKEIDPEVINKIFVVHGHDEEMKIAVARTLEKQDNIKPIILHEQPNKGRTIIEKFEDNSNVSFAVVILSPDDLAYENGQKPEKAKFRARQNVILELGYFIGKIGRERVFVLYQENENFEIPSDYSGVIYQPYDKEGTWQFKLLKELKVCGYNVDANKVII